MLTNEMLRNYYQLVDDNRHGIALEDIARDLNITYYAELFKSINNIHDTEGHINFDVLQLRNRLKEEFFAYLTHILNDAEYEALKSVI